MADSSPIAHAVALAETDLILEWQRARVEGSAHGGELAALLLRANQSLIRRAVRATRRARLDRGDLEQAAAAGLLVALSRFAPGAGAPFGPYAYQWIRKELQRCVAAGDFAIAVPAHLSGRARTAAALIEQAPAATDAEVAGELGTGVSTVAGLRTIAAIQHLHSEPTAIGAVLVDDVAHLVETEAVQTALAALDTRTATIVRLRYGFGDGEPRSHRQVAKLVGVSDFTVRAALTRAHRILARHLTSD